MKELKVGMYVRTPKGIAKIEEITGDRTEIYFNCDTGLSISFIKKDFTQEEMADFYKHSYNIIDLIEENDFINGLRVEKNKYGELYTSYVYYGGCIGKQCEVYTTWLKEYTEDMIENIVTKEQFNSVKYEME